MIESQGYIICRGAHHIPQTIRGTSADRARDASDMDEITVFPDFIGAEACIKRVKARAPGKYDLSIMLGKWTLELVEP